MHGDKSTTGTVFNLPVDDRRFVFLPSSNEKHDVFKICGVVKRDKLEAGSN